jgi:predicted transposase/invertase (TIGR01784 family)
MRRDTIFYQLFAQSPALLFDLIPNPPANPAGYTFDSVEVKETSFRIDGVFSPPNNSGNVYFAEVQFQPDPLFYERLNSEIGIYTYRYREQFYDWRAVVIYPTRSIEQSRLVTIDEFLASGRITRIYLDELTAIEPLPIGVELMLLTTLPDDNALAKARSLIQQLQQRPDSRAIIEMISTIMVYKFTNLTRTEVEAMIGVTLQQTRVYQDAKAEGKAEGVTEGRQTEARSMILRLLSRRFGTLSSEVNEVVAELPLDKLEDLGEALLDFQAIGDLMNWVTTNS